MSKLRERIKAMLPTPVKNGIRRVLNYRTSVREMHMIKAAPCLHDKALERVQQKDGPINVAFFAIFETTWKFDEVFKLLQKDSRFNPVITVCPVINFGHDNMVNRMRECYAYFKSKGYNTIRTFNEETGEYLDIRKELKPDVIFYTNPYRGLIDDRYYIDQFQDILTCYCYYGFPESRQSFFYDTLVSNLVWRQYIPSPKMKEFFGDKIRNHGDNMFFSGYPGIDCFINKDNHFDYNWKIKDNKVKRIIWAPHHTIADENVEKMNSIHYSTFLSYADFMLELAEKYKDKVQIAFKPHPLLRNKLPIAWGEDKAEEYYKKWENLPNGMLCDGAYVDLFMTSDAIIHDSGSFISEYLFTGNPACHLDNGIPYEEKHNSIALASLSHYFKAKCKEDIEKFIVYVINGVDPMKEARVKYVHDELMPPNGRLASENIYQDLVDNLIAK